MDTKKKPYPSEPEIAAVMPINLSQGHKPGENPNLRDFVGIGRQSAFLEVAPAFFCPEQFARVSPDSEESVFHHFRDVSPTNLLALNGLGIHVDDRL